MRAEFKPVDLADRDGELMAVSGDVELFSRRSLVGRRQLKRKRAAAGGLSKGSD